MRGFIVLCVLLAACGDSGGGGVLGGCPYSGALSDCASVAAMTVGAGGVCEGEDTVSAPALESTCDGFASAEYSDCWRACIEAASTCDDALACQDDCASCG